MTLGDSKRGREDGVGWDMPSILHGNDKQECKNTWDQANIIGVEAMSSCVRCMRDIML